MDAVEARLRDKTHVREDGCWMFLGAWNNDGYGRFCVNGKLCRAHGVSYELYVGHIPPGQLVLHKCDHPWCINPKHLFLGTDQDNTNDMIAKGRDVRVFGERHGMARLKEDDVLKIRELIQGGDKLVAIARMFGVTPETVGDIKHRRSWRHI